jgi:hypothetical protein
VLAIFFVPVLFVLVERFAKRGAHGEVAPIPPPPAALPPAPAPTPQAGAR